MTEFEMLQQLFSPSKPDELVEKQPGAASASSKEAASREPDMPIIAEPTPTPPNSWPHESTPAPLPDEGWAELRPIDSREQSRRRMMSRRRQVQADAVAAMVAPMRGVRTVAVANPKGGSGKTPLAVMLAAAFGTQAGKHPVVLDNNPTGNLATRIPQSPSGALTIDDLAVQLATVAAQPSQLPNYLLWQPDSYYAMVSRPRKLVDGPDGHRTLDRPTLSQSEVRGVWDTVARQFPLIIADTGNNDADDQWRGLLPVVDVLVVPVRWQADYCQAANSLLWTLSETGYASLARNAIIVATSPSKPNLRRRQRYAGYFERRSLAVHHLPIDSLVGGDAPIVWDGLSKAMRQSIIELAGMISRRMLTSP